VGGALLEAFLQGPDPVENVAVPLGRLGRNAGLVAYRQEAGHRAVQLVRLFAAEGRVLLGRRVGHPAAGEAVRLSSNTIVAGRSG